MIFANGGPSPFEDQRPEEDRERSPIDAEMEVTRHLINKAINMDALTKIFGRRYYDKMAEREVARVKRHEKEGSTMSMIMVDIDHFKQFNDSYGHDMGDRVLQEVARILEKSVRREDIVARYGGEEFVVILPDTNIKGAKIVAENLREAIEKQTKNQPYPPVTISGGYAELDLYDQSLDSADKLKKGADIGLYQAKEKGRNQMVQYEKGMKIPEKENGKKKKPDQEVATDKEIMDNIERLLPKDPSRRLAILETLFGKARQEFGSK